jgi:hypothetical protein
MNTNPTESTTDAIVQQLATLDYANLCHDQPGLFV